MANKEANKSYKEYSTNFLIDKIDKEKKKLAELYQDLYKLKEDHQRHLKKLTNEKNMIKDNITHLTSPTMKVIKLKRVRELAEKQYEIIKAEREEKQKESEKESQIRLSMAKLDDLRGSLDFLLISGKKFSRKSDVVTITGDEFWVTQFGVVGDDNQGNFLGGNQDTTTDGAAALPSAPLMDIENEVCAVNVHKNDVDFESISHQNDGEDGASRQKNFVKPEKEGLPCPECPVCFEKMMPPARIMQCSNGHLICKECVSKANIIDCPTCRMKIVGRATAMEQHLASLFQGYI